MNRKQNKNKKTQRRNAPVAKGRRSRSSAPRIQSLPRGGFRVTHREYVRDLPGSTSFEVTKLPINPGVGTIFPWLAAIANRFESYSFRRLKFLVEPSASSTDTGRVIVVIDYDVDDAAPPNKTAMLAYFDAGSGQAWEGAWFVAKAADLHKLKTRYVRMGDVPSGKDPKLYDVGSLLIAASGNPDTDVIGEVYVEYEVDLLTPQLSLSCPSAKWTGSGSITKTVPFGTDPTYVGASPATLSGATITWNQAGEFLLWVQVTGTGTSIITALTGTADSTYVDASYNAAGTIFNCFFAVRPQAGETSIVDTSSSTTVSASVTRISGYSYENL
jgi:hypothetical protein